MSNYIIPSEIFVEYVPFDFFSTKNKSLISYKKKDILVSSIQPSASFENKPRSGFILNKNISTQENIYKFNHNPIIFDPLGLEYEISFSNLMEILKTTAINNGVFENEMVISFIGKNLVLVPTNITEVQESISSNNSKFTIENVQKPQFGRTYLIGDEYLVYLGFHSVNFKKSIISRESSSINKTYYINEYQEYSLKKHVFINPETYIFHYLSKFNISSCSNCHEHLTSEYFLDFFNQINSLEFKSLLFDVNISIKELLMNYFKNKKDLKLSSSLIEYIPQAFNGYFFKVNDEITMLKSEREMFKSSLHLNKSVSDFTENGFDYVEAKPNSSNCVLQNDEILEILQLDISDHSKYDKIADLIASKLQHTKLVQVSILSNQKMIIFINDALFDYSKFALSLFQKNSPLISFTKE